MRDSGGHGGSSHPEINIPLLLVGQNCSETYGTHRQIDIAPTLSVLLGQPIPAPSLGVLIPVMLDHLSPEAQLYAYYYNGKHLFNKLSKENDEEGELARQFKSAMQEHKRFLLSDFEDVASFKRAKLFYISSSKGMSERLSTAYINYDDLNISIGLVILITVSIER